MPGHPPWGRRRDQCQDKQGFLLLSAQSGMWVEICRRDIHGLFLRRYKLKEKPTKFLPPQMRMVLWRQWSSLLMSLSVNRFLFSNSSTFATVPSSLFSFKWISSGDAIQLSLWICPKISSSYCCHCPGCVSCGSERPRRTSRLLHQWEKGKTHFIQS